MNVSFTEGFLTAQNGIKFQTSMNRVLGVLVRFTLAGTSPFLGVLLMSIVLLEFLMPILAVWRHDLKQ